MGVPIPLGKMVRFDDCVYGYENGDISKRVDLRITGVLSEFDPVEDIPLMEEDEEIVVQNLGISDCLFGQREKAVKEFKKK